ncbi:MAG: hypothetical protein NTY19_05940 [Planctomycetota bacterium]|nr:hypothetical protein [Planctomycetota bacterium]
MAWPQPTEYATAIQNLHASLSDEELRAGQVALNALGLPMAYSGGFADVYRVHCPATGNTWAVKCFTREAPGLRERYREISAHLQRTGLSFMVDFAFVEPGIRISGQWYPCLKMHWIEGRSLNQFVSGSLNQPKTLSVLLGLWVKLAVRLRQARIAHADLQHGNVLLVPGSRAGRLAIKLIDYDGMHVPSLSATRSGELGHPAYQHPQRLRDKLYSVEVDRFSHLAIYTAIRCLLLNPQDLWQRFDNGDNLLFREVDFRNPGESEVFRTLWALGGEEERGLVGRLLIAAQSPLDCVPLLDEIVQHGRVRPLLPADQQQVAAMLDGRTRQTGSGTFPASEVLPEIVVPAVIVPTVEVVEAEIVPMVGLAEVLTRRVVTLVRRLSGAMVRLVQFADRGLGRLVGAENLILHNFLRVVTPLLVLAGLAFTIGMGASYVYESQAAARVLQAARQAERDHRRKRVEIVQQAALDAGKAVDAASEMRQARDAWVDAFAETDEGLLEKHARKNFEAAQEILA